MRTLGLRDPAFMAAAGNVGFQDVAAYYRCDESLNTDDLVDSVGGVDMAPTGTPEPVTGQVGGARQTVAGEYFSVNDPVFGIGNQSKTFAFWLFVTSSVGGNHDLLRHHDSVSGLTNIQARMGALGLEFGFTDASSNYRQVADSTVFVGFWRHIVCGWDNVNKELFVQIGTAPRVTNGSEFWSPPLTGGSSQCLGASDGAQTMRMDNIGVWNRVLSKAQADELAGGVDYLA